MGLTISSYLADKYLISSDSIEDSDDFFYNKKTSNSDVLSGEADDVSSSVESSGAGARRPEQQKDSKYIIMFNDKIKGYVENSEQAKTVIADIKFKVFKQIGFSPEYMSYWKEIVNTEDNIEELDNGDVVFNAFFVQKNRNLVVSYERVLYNFKIVKVNSVVKKLY